jgi:hypothetical protein
MDLLTTFDSDELISNARNDKILDSWPTDREADSGALVSSSTNNEGSNRRASRRFDRVRPHAGDSGSDDNPSDNDMSLDSLDSEDEDMHEGAAHASPAHQTTESQTSRSAVTVRLQVQC